MRSTTRHANPLETRTSEPPGRRVNRILWLDKMLVRRPHMSAAVASSTRSASSLPTALTTRPAFSAQPLNETSHSDAAPRSRGTSPAKRFQKTESVLDLAVPIQFIKKSTHGAAVPDDGRPLLEAQSAVKVGETLLPAVLRSHPDFQNDPRIAETGEMPSPLWHSRRGFDVSGSSESATTCDCYWWTRRLYATGLSIVLSFPNSANFQQVQT